MWSYSGIFLLIQLLFYLHSIFAMTLIGLTILDAFYKILASPAVSARRCYVTDREVNILMEIFNFEESVFAKPAILANRLGLTEKRVLQIYKRALTKIAKRAKRGSKIFPATIIRNIIDSKRSLNDKSVEEGIFMIMREDLNDFPEHIVFDFLSRLYFVEKIERAMAKEAYRTELENARIARNTRDISRAIVKTEKQEAKFDLVLQTVIWFSNIKKWSRTAFERQAPKRKVNESELFCNGTFWSDKCKRLVQYESGQELYFIKLLEASPQVNYYLEQPVKIEYSRYGRQRSYTPDFAILLNSGHCVLAEVKELTNMAFAVTHRKMEALIEYCERHGFGFLLTNGKYSIGKLLAYKYNLAFESALRERLYEPGAGTLYYTEYRDICEKFKPRYMDLIAIVIKNGWAYYPSVFRLSCKCRYLQFRSKIIYYFGQLK